jgi:hypothetical protein
MPRRWFFRSFRHFGALLPSVILCSCISGQHFKAAEDARDRFHQRLRAHEFEKILNDATPDFRKSMSDDAGPVFFSRVSNILGAPISSKPVTVRENHMTAGVFIQAIYQTHFEKGDAQEDFTWRVEAGTPRLMGYQISSPLLLAH